MNSRLRLGLAAGTAGLLAGLALGVTGLASAADPTPSPSATASQQDGPRQQFREKMRERMQDRGGKAGGHLGKGGLVAAVSTSSLTVRTPMGEKTIGLDAGTKYYENGAEVTRSAVSVGDIVLVKLVDRSSTAPVAQFVKIAGAHLAGWVTAADGGTLTITDPNGFRRTVRTSSATVWTKDGQRATAAIATVGTFVRAHGAVNADGTSLDAAKVAVGKPAKGDKPAGAPAKGPAGP